LSQTLSTPKITQGQLYEGLADYFPGSFLNEPDVFKGTESSIYPGLTRSLSSNRHYREFGENPEVHAGSNIWSGLWWELRAMLGSAVVDKTLVKLWRGLPRDLDSRAMREWFSAKLLENILQQVDSNDRKTKVAKIWKRRGFPTNMGVNQAPSPE